MNTFPKTTFVMESHCYDESNNDTNEVRIEKVTQEETVTELSEMFMKFLQANGFSYVKGVSVVTDGGNELMTDDYYSYVEGGEESESSEPDVTLDFFSDEEQPDVDDVNIYTNQLEFDFPTDNVTLGETYTTTGSFNMYPGDITVTYGGDTTLNYGSSIDDATPEEWDAVAKKS